MVQIKKLSNGLPVVMEKMDHLRSVTFGVWVKVGSSNETAENNGIAHVVEHMMFKGTSKRTAKEIADDCSMIGGNLNAYTSKECTSYYVTTLDSHIEIAVDIISDMLCHSLFKEEDLEKEKSVIIDEIDMYDDSPDDLVHELLQQEVWKDHPLGYIISGTKEIVEGLTREDLVEFVKRYYVADNMMISVTGNFSEEELFELFEEKLGSLEKTSDREEVTIPKFHQTLVSREKDIEQVHLNLAFDAVDYCSDEKYILSIVNSILGGNESSILFQKVREELGLAYSVYSYTSTYYNAGLFQIDATLNPSNVMTVLKTTVELIKEFVEVGVDAMELQRAKEQITTELIIGSESSRNRMNSNGKAMLCREKIVPLDDTIMKVNAVTKEMANAFIKKYLTIDCFSMCLIGNLEMIEFDEIKTYWEVLNNK